MTDENHIIALSEINRQETPGIGLRQVGKFNDYDPSEAREKVRGSIAMYLVYLLIAVVILAVFAGVVLSFICAFKDTCAANALDLSGLKTVIEVILTPLIGLVGSVTGFYFGEKAGAANRANAPT